MKNANKKAHYNLILKLIIFIFGIKQTIQQIINNIIELGGKDFRYNHFSINSNGDMIIDTTANPGNNERRFFGLKKNGRPCFRDEYNNETPFYTIYVQDLPKLEGESNFIKIENENNPRIHGKEYFITFSKANGYIELYDFEQKKIISSYSSKSFFGISISSHVNTFIKANSHLSNTISDYIFSYIYLEDTDYKFYMTRTLFLSTNLVNAKKNYFPKKKSALNRTISSCFQTDSHKIVCFFQKPNYYYAIGVFDEETKGDQVNNLDTGYNENDYEIFFKGIHLKGEIGVFIYYKSLTSTPSICFKYINSDLIPENYRNFQTINIDKSNFIGYALLNDIIKLNDDKICFISFSNDKENLNIVIFKLYNDDYYMVIKYYYINFFQTYGIKFYQDLRGFSYNGFISIAFSYCIQSQCSEIEDLHFSSLIIFNFPNSTDESIDLIQYLYNENIKIEDFSFNLEKNITYIIENNIFGYEYFGIKILNYPDSINLIYADNSNIIPKNTTLESNKNLGIIFISNSLYEKKNYTIEYAIILKEPNYEQMKNLAQDLFYPNYVDQEESYYSPELYTGKTSFFNITINENLITNCNNNCLLCYQNNINYCIICKYNYTFIDNEKTCFYNPSMSTILTLNSSINEPSKTSLLEFPKSSFLISKTTILSTQFSASIISQNQTIIQSEKQIYIQTTNPSESSTNPRK